MNKQKWISVNDKLPEDFDCVMVYAGNYRQDSKYNIVTFRKGISLDERERMKNGELAFEMENGTERWKIYTSSDECQNNQKPYSWFNLPLKYFGQEITHWQPLPSVPSSLI